MKLFYLQLCTLTCIWLYFVLCFRHKFALARCFLQWIYSGKFQKYPCEIWVTDRTIVFKILLSQGHENTRLFGKRVKQDLEATFSVLTHYQTTNFRLFQTERVCRRQFQICRKWQKAIQTGRKHSVFKRLVSQGRQKVSLCGNRLNSWKFVRMIFLIISWEMYKNWSLSQSIRKPYLNSHGQTCPILMKLCGNICHDNKSDNCRPI